MTSGKAGNLWGPSILHTEAGSLASRTLLEPYAVRGRRVKSGWRRGAESDVLQLWEHMASEERNPSEGPPNAQNLGETVDVLTRDERGGETDNRVVAALCPNTEREYHGERNIVINVNEWWWPGRSQETRLGASSTSYKIKWGAEESSSVNSLCPNSECELQPMQA